MEKWSDSDSWEPPHHFNSHLGILTQTVTHNRFMYTVYWEISALCKVRVEKFHGVKFSRYGPSTKNLGAATGAVTLWWQAYLPISARTVKTILPVWPTFPTRCGTDGFFYFSICCSNRLGWYWGRQRTSWIRKIVTVFRCRKNFVREIFVVTDKREICLTAKISQYTVQLYQTPHKMARRLHSGGVVEDDCRYYLCS